MAFVGSHYTLKYPPSTHHRYVSHENDNTKRKDGSSLKLWFGCCLYVVAHSTNDFNYPQSTACCQIYFFIFIDQTSIMGDAIVDLIVKMIDEEERGEEIISMMISMKKKKKNT